ncbi:unnamed protein product [Linum tenue]|uniref:Uncharacterized protein n=2 Tax=Linum tenue TaxID=586396 RepID=A0AAV0J0G8_9ROSI|nr:unnamed protein product [Linum tenue]
MKLAAYLQSSSPIFRKQENNFCSLFSFRFPLFDRLSFLRVGVFHLMASAQFNVVPTSAALRTALSEELVSVANVIHQFPEMPDILGRALQFHQLLVAKKLSLVDESVVPNEVNLSLTNLSVLDDHLQVLVPGANVQGADILNVVRSECTLCDEYLAHVIPRGISYRAVTGYNACLYRKVVELKFGKSVKHLNPSNANIGQDNRHCFSNWSNTPPM